MLFVLFLAVAVWLWLTHGDALTSQLTPDDADVPLNPSDTPPEGSTVDGYVHGAPTSIVVSVIDAAGHVLRQDAAQAFLAMRDAAAAAGVVLSVNSAWRSNEAQSALRQLYVAGTGNLAAPAGYSNHQSGIDVDLETGGGLNAAYRWLTANAASYNFVRTVSSEPWHWEYQG